MHQFNPKYSINDEVFHILPETDKGLILDIEYRVSTREIRYLVSLGWQTEVWALEKELSREKRVI